MNKTTRVDITISSKLARLVYNVLDATEFESMTSTDALKDLVEALGEAWGSARGDGSAVLKITIDGDDT